MENKPQVDMEKVLGRFLKKAVEYQVYAEMPIKDLVRLVDLYDHAYVNVVLEAYRDLDNEDIEPIRPTIHPDDDRPLMVKRPDDEDEEYADPDAPGEHDHPGNHRMGE